MVSPARLSAFLVAGIGPSPMQLGSTPATAVVTIRAIAAPRRPSPPFAAVTSSAAAPSLMPLELAAVTVPSFLNAGFNFADEAIVVPTPGESSFPDQEPSGGGTS